MPFSRRGLLATGGALGLGLAAGATNANAKTDDEADNAPFAAKDHDHAGDYLGESAPVGQIDVDEVVTDSVSTTRYADSVAEVNEYIDKVSGDDGMNGQSGVKIVLREGTLEPDADDLPIELKSGVVVEGQGDKATVIDVDGIGKPVFEFDRSDQSIRRHVTIRDLKVLGNWFDDPGSITPGSKGVHLKNIHYWLIENCQFVGLEVGIDLPGSWTGTVSNCHIDGCGDYGIRAEHFDNSPGGMEPNNIQIKDCEVKRTKRGDPQVGIYVEGGKNVLVDGTDISGSGTYAILAENFGALAVHGSYFENNGHSQDRDGDGQNDPVQIGLAPYRTSGEVRGASIVGNSIGHGPGGHSIGIQLNDVRGVHIEGNYLEGRANKTLVELGPEMENVTIGENCVFDGANRHVVTGPLDGSTIPPNELNDGVWRTSRLGDFRDVEALASEHVEPTLANGIDVVLTDSVGASGTVIDGGEFPPGTLFQGVGTQATTVESSSSEPPVLLTKPAQGVRNLNVQTRGDRSIHVASEGEKSTLTAIDCNAAIDVDGEGTKIIGCDAPVDTADVTAVLDLSLDTGELDPDTGADGGGEADSLAKLTVTQDSPNHWRRMEQEVTVNLDESPYFVIIVPETVGKWNVGVADVSDFVRLFQDSFNTGTMIADVADATGWSGEKTFTLRLYAVRYDSPVYVDSLGLYDSPAAETAAWEDEFDSLSDAWKIRSGLDVEIVSET